MTDDLVTWLHAQLDDDERKVAAMEREERRVQTAPIFQAHPPNWLTGVDIFVSSKRWLAEVEAKRMRLDQILHELGDDSTDETAQWLLKVEALPYAARDGWRDEWRPEPLG